MVNSMCDREAAYLLPSIEKNSSTLKIKKNVGFEDTSAGWQKRSRQPSIED